MIPCQEEEDFISIVSALEDGIFGPPSSFVCNLYGLKERWLNFTIAPILVLM